MKKVIEYFIYFAILLILILYFKQKQIDEVGSNVTYISEATMNLTSSAFAQGQPIPKKFSCKGADVSPALAWIDPPVGTKSFALIMDDPDAPSGNWVHWVLFNIPPETRSLTEAIKPAAPIVVGRNSSGQKQYDGPCPPSGTHRYFFKLYALDTTLNLTSNADKKVVLAAMEDHILAQAELMGTFSK